MQLLYYNKRLQTDYLMLETQIIQSKINLKIVWAGRATLAVSTFQVSRFHAKPRTASISFHTGSFVRYVNGLLVDLAAVMKIKCWVVALNICHYDENVQKGTLHPKI